MAETVRRLDLPTGASLRPGPGQPPGPGRLRYETFEDLVGYCRLSANPVGRMVLAIFGVATPQRNTWSDSTCTALQLVEHWQDVAEDAIVGRVYLPLEDMRRFGVSVEELVPPPAGYVDRRRRGAAGGASSGRAAPFWPSKQPGPGGCSTTAAPWWPASKAASALRSPVSRPVATPPWTAWLPSTSTFMPSRPGPRSDASAPTWPVWSAECLPVGPARGRDAGGDNLNAAAVALAYKQCERITRS